MPIIITESSGSENVPEQVTPSAPETEQPPADTPTAEPASAPAPETDPETPAEADPETETADTDAEADGTDAETEPEPAHGEPKRTRWQRYQDQIARERDRADRLEALLADLARTREQPGRPAQGPPPPPAAPPVAPPDLLTWEQFAAQYEAQTGVEPDYDQYHDYRAVAVVEHRLAREHAMTQQREFTATVTNSAETLSARGREQFPEWDAVFSPTQNLPSIPPTWVVKLSQQEQGPAVLFTLARDQRADLVRIGTLLQTDPSEAYGEWMRVVGRLEATQPWAATAPPVSPHTQAKRMSATPTPLPPVTPSSATGLSGYDPEKWEKRTQFNGDDFRDWVKHNGLHLRRAV